VRKELLKTTENHRKIKRRPKLQRTLPEEETESDMGKHKPLCAADHKAFRILKKDCCEATTTFHDNLQARTKESLNESTLQRNSMSFPPQM
jgi:hypothetical protein